MIPADHVGTSRQAGCRSSTMSMIRRCSRVSRRSQHYTPVTTTTTTAPQITTVEFRNFKRRPPPLRIGFAGKLQQTPADQCTSGIHGNSAKKRRPTGRHFFSKQQIKTYSATSLAPFSVGLSSAWSAEIIFSLAARLVDLVSFSRIRADFPDRSRK